ncbi:MAG: DUF4382 domain-containing protein [Bacteroidia bacterium]|nr:DUF4382 domain-containing protein [Bacteroidia bacterium]
MTFPQNRRGLLTFCLGFLFIFNCSVEETFNPDNVASLSVGIKGSESPYDRFVIDLSEVHVKVIDDENDPDCWWRISSSNPGIYDLQELVDGRQVLLTDASSLPIGRIYAIKLVLGPNNYVIRQGSKIDLYTNSIQLGNLNMPVDRMISKGKSYGLDVEMDLSSSILDGPLDGQLILNPQVNYDFHDLKRQ